MKSYRTMLLNILCLIFVRVELSGGARLLEKDLFVSPENRLAFCSRLNAVVAGEGSAIVKNPAEKTGAQFEDAVMKPWTSSVNYATNDNIKLMFQENRSGGDTKAELPKADKVAYNVVPNLTHRGNVMVYERLFRSKHSPGVGHMEIFNTAKSTKQEGVAKKWILKSTPSPGAGH